jgi:hypothetical protein
VSAANTKPYSVPGKFSMSVPSDFTVTEDSSEPQGIWPSRTIKGDRGRGRGLLNMRAVELKNTTNKERDDVLRGLTEDIQGILADMGTTMLEIKGLERNRKIPDVVDFTFNYRVDGSPTFAGGRIVFGLKRMGVMTFTCFNTSDAQFMRSILQTYQEL